MSPSDLMGIMNDRYEHSATVMISQLPTEQWYPSIGDNTVADAILDNFRSADAQCAPD